MPPLPSQQTALTITSLLRLVALGLISGAAIAPRLFSVVEFESIIHEFDPWFNYRATRILTSKGFHEFWNWFDANAWYPLGRVVGGTVYPGLMATSGIIYAVLHAMNLPVDIRNICVLLAPGFSALTAWATYMFTKEMKDESAGLLAAAFIAVAPGYISRSVAGSYDNEAIAITLLMITFYSWIKALKLGSALFGTVAAMFYFYMVAAWGGYVFITNMIPLHALALMLMGRYTGRLYVAYSTWYAIGTLASMQVPFVGFQPVSTSDHMAALGVFGLVQIVALTQVVKSHVSSTQFQGLLSAGLILALGVIAFAGMTYRGMIAPWTGRFYSLWDTSYAAKHIPIIASVSEHQPTAWPSLFRDLQFLLFLLPAGLALCFYHLRDEHVFVVLYAVAASYFAGVMNRLVLTLTPVVCVATAMAVSEMLDVYLDVGSEERTEKEKEKEIAEAEDADAASKPKRPGPHIHSLDTRLAVILPLCSLLAFFILHSTWVTDVSYSSPSVVLATYNRDGTRNIVDDFREAYAWLRQNTAEDAVVLSWWDYGYQIAGMAQRTTIVDNNTWNNTHIATVGKIMSSPESIAYPLLRNLDVDYILILFGGVIGFSGDDINKFMWMVRIAEGVWPDEIQEARFLDAQGEYGAIEAMRESLLFKMSYYRFADRIRFNQGRSRVVMDRVRNQPAPIGVSLDYLEEAFSTENWMVRIYKVKREDVLGRDLKSANAFVSGVKRGPYPERVLTRRRPLDIHVV
ncbi:oligosaccharyl transferase STT3 subunit [Roridomyces roridus]|uniref:dolichyl-diphosphooligosaccharide--protein glycotransferase n=1 Tax=Roridomyces roridus TaxID=1738132 RepID=A0AAD7BG77_9AGAR|nr:oligosaccharyl transferase STT3 subunit [Roridomyces roridus]